MTNETIDPLTGARATEFVAIFERLPGDPSATEDLRDFYRQQRTLNEKEETLMKFTRSARFGEARTAAGLLKFTVPPIIAIGVLLVIASARLALMHSDEAPTLMPATLVGLAGLCILLIGAGVMRDARRRKQTSSDVAERCNIALRVSAEVAAENAGNTADATTPSTTSK